MLKIQRRTNGEVVFTVSGRLGGDNVGELSALLAAEPAGKTRVLDLKVLLLVDREIVGSCGRLRRYRLAQPQNSPSG